MSRVVCTAVLVVLLNLMVGCGRVDSGKGQLIPAQMKGSAPPAAVAAAADAAEVDLVEQLAMHRKAYRQALVMLVDYYTKTGNNMKLQWAKQELQSFDTMPQYKYIIEAGTAGPELKATTSIPEADQLYDEAVALHKEAERLVVVKDDDLLRLALDKYNALIRKYPSSDKIDDAAFKAGQIYEYFKDYSIALIYYQRAFQWDPATPYPARFRAAYILDQHMHRRAEALKLYQQALGTEGKNPQYDRWKEFAERRIAELTKVNAPPQK